MTHITLHAKPREIMNKKAFIQATPENSIALDGMVVGGPFYDEKTRHANFDHHDSVVREATMSTCKQVYFAIKGGLFQSFRKDGEPHADVYFNDSDQDTSLAIFELKNYKLFEGTQSIPALNRLISLTDELDITGGSFPRNLDESLMKQHNWVFEPYTSLRKSGDLSHATEQVLLDNVDAVLSRLKSFLMGEGEEKELDIRHEVIYQSPHGFKLINEIGGNEARYYMFAHGLDSFISIVATRPDSKRVITIGRRSRYIPFPQRELYTAYNQAEGLPSEEGWNGSDIVGGSSRKHGTGLTNEKLIEIAEKTFVDVYGGRK